MRKKDGVGEEYGWKEGREISKEEKEREKRDRRVVEEVM